MATLITVLRSGGRYDPEWVERLARGARLHVKGLDRVVCLTDCKEPMQGVDSISLNHDWPRWWAKMEAFRPELSDDINILCDLDTLFLNSADNIAEGDDFVAMEDYFLKGRISTALMRWKGSSLSFVYDQFNSSPERWMEAGSCGIVPNSVHGDQVVVDHFLRLRGLMPTFIQQKYPNLLDFYGAENANMGPILIFIGDAKPDNAVQKTRSDWLKG